MVVKLGYESSLKEITEISNSDDMLKHCEPNLTYHHRITESQARRILLAFIIHLEDKKVIE